MNSEVRRSLEERCDDRTEREGGNIKVHDETLLLNHDLSIMV